MKKNSDMTKYIDRNALMAKLHSGTISIWFVDRFTCRRLRELSHKIDRVIESMPAADVAPIKHGHWNVYSVRDCLYTCSECHCVPRDKTLYCPMCGARMDM